MLDEPLLKEIGAVHGKTPVQVAVRWFVQQPGVIAIPRSSSPEHIVSNNDVHDFELSADEMGRINALKASHLRLIDPDWAPAWDSAA